MEAKIFLLVLIVTMDIVSGGILDPYGITRFTPGMHTKINGSL